MKLPACRQSFATRLASLILPITACAGLLCSCETAPEKPAGDYVFRFTVMLYKQPVEVKSWVMDQAQSANPEGAALNIATAMQRGDVDRWIASWDEPERPKLSPEDRQALLKKWQPLKEGHLVIHGRVVADADLVMELSVHNPERLDEKIQLPLKRSQGQWWLTAMDTNSDFLNWQIASNKIVIHRENFALLNYLARVKSH